MAFEQQFDVDEMETFLNEYYPKVRHRAPTFLEIAQVPHYENVDSNILAFFLEANAAHGFGDLFLTALLQLIEGKSEGMPKSLNFGEWVVEREVTTIKNNRIDIVIKTPAEDAVIIIENKIYHWLANDLVDYWDHFKKIPIENRVGIVLGLKPAKLSNANFISVTHEEYNARVMNLLGGYLANCNDKYLVYLKDYMENMERFTLSDDDKKQFSFYFKNMDKINALCSLRDKLNKSLLDQMENSCNDLNLVLDSKRSGRLRYFILPRTKDIYYTILIEGAFDGTPTYTIYLECNNLDQETINELKRAVASEAKTKELSVLSEDKKYAWFHLVQKTYNIPVDNVDTFSTDVVKHIEEDFQVARKILVDRYLELKPRES